jgi:hypothetical protein
MTRFTRSGQSALTNRWQRIVVLLIVRSAAYASLVGNIVDGTAQRRVQAWLLMLPASSIGLAQEYARQYGSSCVIVLLSVLLLRWAWKLT